MSSEFRIIIRNKNNANYSKIFNFQDAIINEKLVAKYK